MTQEKYRRAEWNKIMVDYPPCFNCGEPAVEAAHRIAATKVSKNILGFFVVHCHFNLLPSCKKHNDYAMHFDSLQDKKDMILSIWKYLDILDLQYNKIDDLEYTLRFI